MDCSSKEDGVWGWDYHELVTGQSESVGVGETERRVGLEGALCADEYDLVVSTT